MAVYPEDLVPKQDHKKEHYYEFRSVNRGLLVDYFTERNPKSRQRIHPQISILIEPEQSVVTIWGARRCSYKAHPGGFLDDRTIPNSCRRPIEIEHLTNEQYARYLFHQEVKHQYLRGLELELNAFLFVMNPIQIAIQPIRHVSIFYAQRVFVWNGTNPQDVIFLHDTAPAADFRTDELYLTEKDKGHVLPFSKPAS